MLYKGCLHYGYTIGHNEAAVQQGYAVLLAFLNKNFHLEHGKISVTTAASAGQ